ncbi:MAG: DUF1499 domain-containing protein [Smithella sp.]|jgi:uncharacterized protein (DUF1499 family)
MKIKLAVSAAFLVFFTGLLVRASADVGLRDGKLSECPDSPNCVSSQTQMKGHTIEPLSYKGSLSDAKQALLSVISSLPRTKIILDNDRYIHVTFTSHLMRFVDDVEFLFDDTNKQIHVRSASRVGYSDMGVNRKRVENLRKLLNDRLKI